MDPCQSWNLTFLLIVSKFQFWVIWIAFGAKVMSSCKYKCKLPIWAGILALNCLLKIPVGMNHSLLIMEYLKLDPADFRIEGWKIGKNYLVYGFYLGFPANWSSIQHSSCNSPLFRVFVYYRLVVVRWHSRDWKMLSPLVPLYDKYEILLWIFLFTGSITAFMLWFSVKLCYLSFTCEGLGCYDLLAKASVCVFLPD